MLVLTRKMGEEIIIDGSIRVKILAVTRNKIQLGIDAPPAVRVVREELLDRDAIIPQSIDAKSKGYQGSRMPIVPTATSA